MHATAFSRWSLYHTLSRDTLGAATNDAHRLPAELDSLVVKRQEGVVMSISTDVSIPRLRADLRGQVIGPDDAGFDDARAVVAGGIDRRPRVIIKVAGAADVVRVVTLARETGLPLAVRSGGHSGAAHGVVDDGIVLDVRELKGLTIDVAQRTAWAGSGLTAGEYTAAAAEHGLGTGFGDTGSVGLGGLTTGGGIGYMVRLHGLTIDSLLAAEMVTADGQHLRVDADQNQDLFWAIRGGGGNLGVVTRFQFRLQEVGTIVGGMLILPATAETVAGFISAAESAPEGLSTIANVMPCPPMPFIPEEHHGKLVILGMLCHVGPVEDGEKAVAPFRALATPLADMVKPMSYPEMYPPEDPDYHPTAIARTMFLDHVDLATARTIVEQLEASDASMRVVQLRVLGGAMARVPVEATAFAHRGSKLMAAVAAFYEGPDDMPRRRAWVAETSAALQQSDQGAYVNFLADEGADRIHAAYPGATWDRLAAIKRRYDPTNLFRINQNVPPAPDMAGRISSSETPGGTSPVPDRTDRADRSAARRHELEQCGAARARVRAQSARARERCSAGSRSRRPNPRAAPRRRRAAARPAHRCVRSHLDALGEGPRELPGVEPSATGSSSESAAGAGAGWRGRPARETANRAQAPSRPAPTGSQSEREPERDAPSGRTPGRSATCSIEQDPRGSDGGAV